MGARKSARSTSSKDGRRLAFLTIVTSVDWAGLLSRTHRNCGACATCPHVEVAAAEGIRKSRLPAVSGTVWALGLTSLLTDVSSEMVASVLPLYLVLHLGMTPLAFGLVDGLYQGAAALVRVTAGILSDRSQRYKSIAALGYGLSAACRLLILVAGAAWTTIASIIRDRPDRKGIRTAPRDALISQRSPCRGLATAFGVHRALDAAGAMLGPIVAFGLLAAMPDAFDVLFVVSFAIAIVGVVAIVTFVPAKTERDRVVTSTPTSVRTALALFVEPRFKPIAIAGSVLGAATMSDAFVFLVLQRRLGISAVAFPLLYVGTSLFTSVFSVPCGRLADRFGRSRILLAGYCVLALVYTALLLPATLTPVVVAMTVIALLGAYYSATDGVLTAMAAAVLPGRRSGSGLSLLATGDQRRAPPGLGGIRLAVDRRRPGSRHCRIPRRARRCDSGGDDRARPRRGTCRTRRHHRARPGGLIASLVVFARIGATARTSSFTKNTLVAGASRRASDSSSAIGNICLISWSVWRRCCRRIHLPPCPPHAHS